MLRFSGGLGCGSACTATFLLPSSTGLPSSEQLYERPGGRWLYNGAQRTLTRSPVRALTTRTQIRMLLHERR
jgi:hypothetical protein